MTFVENVRILTKQVFRSHKFTQTNEIIVYELENASSFLQQFFKKNLNMKERSIGIVRGGF